MIRYFSILMLLVVAVMSFPDPTNAADHNHDSKNIISIDNAHLNAVVGGLIIDGDHNTITIHIEQTRHENERSFPEDSKETLFAVKHLDPDRPRSCEIKRKEHLDRLELWQRQMASLSRR